MPRPDRLIEPRELLRAIVLPALASASELTAKPRLADPRAALLLTAIAIQESDLRWVRQWPAGPGSGYWQMEPETGGRAMRRATLALGPPWRSLLEHFGLDGPLDDVLVANQLAACVAARLLLWHDPHRLPDIGDVDAAWQTYAVDVWRPGKPHPAKWPFAYAEALQAAEGLI